MKNELADVTNTILRFVLRFFGARTDMTERIKSTPTRWRGRSVALGTPHRR